MPDNGRILVINPGSTSTKLAVYNYTLSEPTLTLAHERQIAVEPGSIGEAPPIIDQVPSRTQQVTLFLQELNITPDLIMARGAPLRPLEGGIFGVNPDMLADIRSGKYANHASNLGALIGDQLAEIFKVPAFIADPITTDEFEPIARISGVPEIQRRSRSHALNIKACVRRICSDIDQRVESSRWVVAHLGGGISIAAVKYGRIVDVNDGLLGMGPFSPERAGALPLEGLLDLAASGELDLAQMKTKLSRESGLKAYLGTSDLRTIEKRILDGDAEADLVLKAMIYQIAKEMAAMAAVLDLNLSGFILTGGMAHSALVCQPLIEKFSSLAHVYVEAGENEGQALAEAGLRILLNHELPKKYFKDQ